MTAQCLVRRAPGHHRIRSRQAAAASDFLRRPVGSGPPRRASDRQAASPLPPLPSRCPLLGHPWARQTATISVRCRVFLTGLSHGAIVGQDPPHHLEPGFGLCGVAGITEQGGAEGIRPPVRSSYSARPDRHAAPSGFFRQDFTVSQRLGDRHDRAGGRPSPGAWASGLFATKPAVPPHPGRLSTVEVTSCGSPDHRCSSRARSVPPAVEATASYIPLLRCNPPRPRFTGPALYRSDHPPRSSKGGRGRGQRQPVPEAVAYGRALRNCSTAYAGRPAPSGTRTMLQGGLRRNPQ